MNILKTTLLALFVVAGTPAQAAMVSYMLDQSSTSAGTDDYVKLTLSDDTRGQLVIQVESLVGDSSADGYADIKSLSLNVTDEALDIRSIVLPDAWKARRGNKHDEFNIQLFALGNARLDSLAFTIPGLTLADVEPAFSLQLWGIVASGNTDFTGSSQVFSPVGSTVPVPAAVWLFGSGLLGLLSVARYRRSQ